MNIYEIRTDLKLGTLQELSEGQFFIVVAEGIGDAIKAFLHGGKTIREIRLTATNVIIADNSEKAETK